MVSGVCVRYGRRNEQDAGEGEALLRVGAHQGRKVLVVPGDDDASLGNGPSEDLRVICLAQSDLGSVDQIQTLSSKLLQRPRVDMLIKQEAEGCHRVLSTSRSTRRLFSIMAWISCGKIFAYSSACRRASGGTNAKCSRKPSSSSP